jgi:glycosyltransferase involved in cell wall biosynthesis
MNILFIHETDYIDKVVYEWQQLAEGLSKRGHKVYVVDYPHRWTSETKMGQIVIARTNHDKGHPISIVRPYFIKIPILSRISAFFTHYKAIEKAIKNLKIDVIILYSVPTNGLQACYLAHKYKIPIIFRSIDILHRMVHNPILSFITKQLEKIVYKNVDLILANTPNYADYVKSMNARNVQLLLMPVDTEYFRPMLRDIQFMQKHGVKKDDKVILFVGTLFSFCGIREFLEAISPYLLVRNDIKILIVGERYEYHKLKERYKAVSNVKFLGYQDYKEIPKFINIADVCISTFIKTKKTDDIFTGKVMQYLACGKPVVATQLKGLTCLNAGGIWYGYDWETFIMRVLYLLDNSLIAHSVGSIGLYYVRMNHSQEVILDDLEKILKESVAK